MANRPATLGRSPCGLCGSRPPDSRRCASRATHASPTTTCKRRRLLVVGRGTLGFYRTAAGSAAVGESCPEDLPGYHWCSAHRRLVRRSAGVHGDNGGHPIGGWPLGSRRGVPAGDASSVGTVCKHGSEGQGVAWLNRWRCRRGLRHGCRRFPSHNDGRPGDSPKSWDERLILREGSGYLHSVTGSPK